MKDEVFAPNIASAGRTRVGKPTRVAHFQACNGCGLIRAPKTSEAETVLLW